MKGTGTESIALGKSKPTLSGAEFLSRWKEIVHEGKKYTEGISFHCREKSAKGFPGKESGETSSLQLQSWNTNSAKNPTSCYITK